MTKAKDSQSGEGITFAGKEELITAYQEGALSLHARIKISLEDGKIIETTWKSPLRISIISLYAIPPAITTIYKLT